MRFVSQAALATVLAFASTALTIAPAEAQSKKKAEEPVVQVNDTFRTAAIEGETAAKAGDYATAKAKLAAADAAATTDIEKLYAANLRLQVAQGTKDNAMLATAIDQLLANPNTPATQKPALTYNRGILALQNKQNDQAATYFQQAKQLGYDDPNIDLRLAQIELQRGNVDAGVAAVEKAIEVRKAAGQQVPEEWYNVVISQLYKANRPTETTAWMRRELQEYPTTKNWHKALVLFRDRAERDPANKNAQRIDVMRLMRDTNTLVDENAYREYAAVASELGLPYETVAVIDEGRAKGKISGNAAAFNQLKTSAQSSIKAEGSLASLDTKAKASANGRLAAGTANAYLASGNTAKAVELFQLALSKGGVDADEVNTRLGIALARAGRKDEAKQAFASVKGQRAELASLWTLYLNTPQITASASPLGTATASN